MFHFKTTAMQNRMIMIVSVVVFLGACDTRKLERAKLNHQIDSLKMELITSHKMAETLEEVGALIDSIDANRHLLRTSMVEGTSLSDYEYRMHDINNFVKVSVAKIEELEKSLKSSKSSASQYAGAIAKLKAELDTRNQELTKLNEQVALYRNENSNLISTVELQRAEIEDKIKLIHEKEAATVHLEDQIRQMLIQSKLDEAEAYYNQALALEEAAKRTKFAPRKKRETNRQALDLYELALVSGKAEAQQKVTELKKKI